MTPFDPLHKWLGIPPREQPPDHYRLLNIPTFESDPEVITHAADRQMAHVRTFQIGAHAIDSQRILNELSVARLCLLNAERKAAYDAALQTQLAAPAQSSVVKPPPLPKPSADVGPSPVVAPSVDKPTEGPPTELENFLSSPPADDTAEQTGDREPDDEPKPEKMDEQLSESLQLDRRFGKSNLPPSPVLDRIEPLVRNWKTIVPWRYIGVVLGLTAILLFVVALFFRARPAADDVPQAPDDATNKQAIEEAKQAADEEKFAAMVEQSRAEATLRREAEAVARREAEAKARQLAEKTAKEQAEELARQKAEAAAKELARQQLDAAAKVRLAAVFKKFKEQYPSFDETRVSVKVEEGVVTELTLNANGLIDLSPLQDFRELKVLKCWGTSQPDRRTLRDLAPLRGMQLTELDVSDTLISDLSPLVGMPLARLRCDSTEVSDLSPLQGMPLKSLSCGSTKITNLVAIKGLTLTYFSCGYTQVSDLSPLKGMPLTGLSCLGTKVIDLSPLEGMPLKSLNCLSTAIASLAPLKNSPLEQLDCRYTRVFDLSPLQGMSVKGLDCEGTRISDLSPLKGTPLTSFNCESTKVTDLSPLAGLPLITLNCSRTSVSDISALHNCRTLKYFDLQYTKVPEADVIAFRKALPLCVTPFVPK